MCQLSTDYRLELGMVYPCFYSICPGNFNDNENEPNALQLSHPIPRPSLRPPWALNQFALAWPRIAYYDSL